MFNFVRAGPLRAGHARPVRETDFRFASTSIRSALVASCRAGVLLRLFGLWRRPAAMRDFADGPGMTSCHPVLAGRRSASPVSARTQG